MEDKRSILKEEEPFGYREMKDSRIHVTFQGKSIKILQGKDYSRFQRVAEKNDPYQIQLFLAKVTGQFKHGNERQGKNSKKR